MSAVTACRLLDIGPAKLVKLIKAGKIRAVWVGDRRMVVYASLLALLADKPQQQMLEEAAA